jgi:hypothetical protein
MAGSPFLIEADADADEMGGLAFDGTNYLAVWESDAGNSNGVFTVKGRFITPAGDLLGSRLEISGGATGQRFPDTAWNGESYLVMWTSQTAGTNEWNVRGRRLNRDGVLMDSILINENPAQQPWPPALASDGTNWLAAWSRESGPYPVLNSNLWLPMLFGRIVARDGTVSGHEISIRRGGLGQFKPKVTFNGDNYLVGWVEKARWDEKGPPPSVAWFWQSGVRQVNSSGQPVLAEFYIHRYGNYVAIAPPGMTMGEGAGRFVVAWEFPEDHFIWELTLNRLNRSFALQNFTRLPSGDMKFNLVGPKTWSYGVEVTTNLVDWSGVPDPRYGDYFRTTGQVEVSSALAGAGGRSFFRAFDGQTACRENQRSIQQAKEHWALDQNKNWSASPLDTDLFGPGRYLPSKPVCPNGGVYGGSYYTQCSLGAVAGHTY